MREEKTMNRTEKTIAVFAIVCLLIFTAGLAYLLFFSGKSVSLFRGKNFLSAVSGETRALQRAAVAYELRDEAKALEAVQDFLVDHPKSRFRNKATLIAANVFFDRKDYSGARKHALSVIDTLSRSDAKSEASVDDYVDSIILLGKISKETGFFEPSVVNFLEDSYVKADAEKKSDIAVYLGYANLYAKNHTNALRYFNSVSGEWALIGRARVYIDQNKYPEAIQEYLNYFSTYPRSERWENVKYAFVRQSFFYADQLQKAGLFAQSVQYFLNVANYFPRDNAADEALVRAAEVYARHRDYSNALNFLNRALANSVTASDDRALYQKGLIYYQQGKMPESARVFQDLIDKHPKSALIPKSREWIRVMAREMEVE